MKLAAPDPFTFPFPKAEKFPPLTCKPTDVPVAVALKTVATALENVTALEVLTAWPMLIVLPDTETPVPPLSEVIPVLVTVAVEPDVETEMPVPATTEVMPLVLVDGTAN